MFRSIVLCCGMAVSFAAAAQQPARYVSDELAIVLRASPANDSASLGTLISGARLELLESGAAAGYARVRTGDGREGWVLERYLKTEPIARERLQRVEKELAGARNELGDAQAELKKIKGEHGKLVQDFSRIADSAGKVPAIPAEVLKETEDLRARVQQLEQERTGLLGRVDSAAQEQRTLVLGGSLVAGGFVLALLLHWLWPKRRWGDL